MSYQIKSTPFFRRMLSTSKRNGQLQKLKEEYERMKDFNDRTIEMKMREVRLKRLFKDIEDIKELSYHLPKRSRTSHRKKTAEDIRVETFVRARELGKEFSKLNGLLAPTCSKSHSKEQFSQFSNMNTTQKERKLLVQKARNYGNEHSRMNSMMVEMPNVLTRRKRCCYDITRTEPNKREILLQRIRYGNSCSNINMAKIPRRDAKHQIATDSSTFESKMPGLHKERSISNYKNLPSNSLKNLHLSSDTFVQEKPSTSNSIVSPSTGNSYEAHLRAKKYWRKVALTVLNRFDKAIRCATNVDDTASDDNTENEFRLRTISNATDLTSSTTVPEKKNRSTIEMSPNEHEQNEEDEVLLHVEPLYEQPRLKSAYSTPKVDVITPSETKANILDTIKDLSEKVASYDQPRPTSDKVHQLAKIFEPFVREAAQKEAFDGVQKLKSIFEYQGE